MKNKSQNYIWIFAELLLIAVGIYGLKINTVGSNLTNIFYFIIGLGIVALALSISNLIKESVIKGDEELERSINRMVNDERNQMIATKAGAKAFKLTNALILAIILSFTIMNIDKIVLIALFTLLIVVNIYVYIVSSKLQKTI